MDSEMPRNSRNRIISLADVSLRYDSDWILRNINLDVYRGDFLAVSGPNGGGKTTLLKLMLKLLKPSQGNVEYYDAQGKLSKKLNIGYLPQKSTVDLKFPITVRQMILSGLIKGWGLKMPSDTRMQLEYVTELLGIEGYIDRQIGRISGGQLQRALLARAIISRPEIVVLDEPLSYVDKHFESQIYTLIEELAHHSTIVLVSHEMTVISRLANRHIIVNRGIEMCHSSEHGPLTCP